MSHRSRWMMLWDFLWVFWLLRLFFNISVRSFFSLSNYLNLEVSCCCRPRWWLVFFLAVLLYFYFYFLSADFSSSNFRALLLHYSCSRWMSLIYTTVSRT